MDQSITRNRHQKSILLVDDEPLMARIITRFLERDNNIVYRVTNGAEALSVFKKGAFSMILTDVVMPVMDGIELTESIRKLNRHIPIVAMSVTEENLRLAKFAGANSTFLKSHGVTRMLEIVKSHL